MLDNTEITRAVQAAGNSLREVKLSAGGELVLRIRSRGRPSWLLRYRKPGGGESMLRLGDYPALDVEAARKAAEAQRVLLAGGVDPVAVRRHLRAQRAPRAAQSRVTPTAPSAPTFSKVAERWLAHETASGAKPATVATHQGGLRLLEPLADVPVNELTTARLAAHWAAIVAHKDRREFAPRAAGVAHSVLKYAAAIGACDATPAAACEISRASIPSPQVEHRAAVTDGAQLGALLRAVQGYKGRSNFAQAALVFSALTAQRPLEIRSMTWSEVDTSTAVWVIPSERYKIGRLHRVHLSTQALAVLEQLGWLRLNPAGPDDSVFEGARRGRPMSENTLNSALSSLLAGAPDIGAHAAHGFRAAFKTICGRELKAKRDVVELCMGHTIAGAVESAYLRDPDDLWHDAERRELMQRWADYLDQLKATQP